jgi:biotin synthase
MNTNKRQNSNMQLTESEIVKLLNITSKNKLLELFSKALKIKHQNSGPFVYSRALFEISNICTKDCCYCGIRKSNITTERYQLNRDEIISSIEKAYTDGFRSIVIQAGERTDQKFVNFITSLLQEIQQKFNSELRVTLSLGEQKKETYKEWFDVGASRYLLRIETTNKKLFSKIHPKDIVFENRLKCLDYLAEIGYQVGTGVMIGIPGQTIEDLAKDIIFFTEKDIDMIGMGPYIPHINSPMAKEYPNSVNLEKNLQLALKMIAVTRIYTKNLNIAATTALETINADAILEGILAGANVIMLNYTDTAFKNKYSLYNNKQRAGKDIHDRLNKWKKQLTLHGEEIIGDKWGDSAHYKAKIIKK